MSSLLELRHADMEHRMLITTLSISQLGGMIHQSMLIVQAPATFIHKAAVMSGVPADAVAGLFVVSAMLVLPNTGAIVAWKNRFANRGFVKLAVVGSALCSFIWGFLAYSVRNLDIDWYVTGYFVQQSLVAMAFSATLGVMLNNQMKRRLRVVQPENEEQPTVA